MRRNPRQTAQNAYYDTIVRSIYTIYNEYQRHNNEERSRKQGDRFWEILGVYALLFAAAVGVAAILVGTNDAAEQRGVMRRQLDAMEAEERPWIAAPKIEWQVIDSPPKINFSFTFRNVGKTPTTGLYIGATVSPGENWQKETNGRCERGKLSKASQNGMFQHVSIVPESDFSIGNTGNEIPQVSRRRQSGEEAPASYLEAAGLDNVHPRW
jgi:hypothetical protein